VRKLEVEEHVLLLGGGVGIYGAQIATEAGDFLQPNRQSNWRVPAQPAPCFCFFCYACYACNPSLLGKAPLAQCSLRKK